MALKLYNTLTKQVDIFTQLNSKQVTIYSCGPTVYDHAHIGNLSSFIFADILRRVIAANNWPVRHVMNLTDVDDKTIRRSRETYPNLNGMEALKKLTSEYSELFMQDMRTIGNDVDALYFMRATDETTVDGMRELVTELYKKGFAYVADDGVYFSIDAYRRSGKTYGQLVTLTEASTSAERIQNDEYDKESPHDFALWKAKKPGEPAWELTIDNHNMAGRPGWHIECSVMSRLGLGQPFDLHTGGIDLAFPHHENEIAQSTAGHDNPTYAATFIHNEHMLVEGKKMAKSSNNFYTLADLIAKGIDPLSFRLLVLQAHYRKPTNFSLENVAAAHNRLHHWRNVAALRWQTYDTLRDDDNASADNHTIYLNAALGAMLEALNEDLNTPAALAIIDEAFSRLTQKPLTRIHQHGLLQLLESIDTLLGLSIIDSTPDISDDTKQIILERERARDNKDWQRADELRNIIAEQEIIVRDTVSGSVWEYI
jgi:cysteinyl-tRNA synthetase